MATLSPMRTSSRLSALPRRLTSSLACLNVNSRSMLCSATFSPRAARLRSRMSTALYISGRSDAFMLPPLCCRDHGHTVNFDQRIVVEQRPHLHQRHRGKVATEHSPVRLANGFEIILVVVF